jgi:hypothetical protein
MTYEPGRDPDFERRMRDVPPADRFYERDTSIGLWPMLLLGVLFVAVAAYLLFGSSLIPPTGQDTSARVEAPVSAPTPTPQPVPKAPN